MVKIFEQILTDLDLAKRVGLPSSEEKKHKELEDALSALYGIIKPKEATVATPAQNSIKENETVTIDGETLTPAELCEMHNTLENAENAIDKVYTENEKRKKSWWSFIPFFDAQDKTDYLTIKIACQSSRAVFASYRVRLATACEGAADKLITKLENQVLNAQITLPKEFSSLSGQKVTLLQKKPKISEPTSFLSSLWKSKETIEKERLTSRKEHRSFNASFVNFLTKLLDLSQSGNFQDSRAEELLKKSRVIIDIFEKTENNEEIESTLYEDFEKDLTAIYSENEGIYVIKKLAEARNKIRTKAYNLLALCDKKPSENQQYKIRLILSKLGKALSADGAAPHNKLKHKIGLEIVKEFDTLTKVNESFNKLNTLITVLKREIPKNPAARQDASKNLNKIKNLLANIFSVNIAEKEFSTPADEVKKQASELVNQLFKDYQYCYLNLSASEIDAFNLLISENIQNKKLYKNKSKDGSTIITPVTEEDFVTLKSHLQFLKKFENLLQTIANIKAPLTFKGEKIDIVEILKICGDMHKGFTEIFSSENQFVINHANNLLSNLTRVYTQKYDNLNTIQIDCYESVLTKLNYDFQTPETGLENAYTNQVNKSEARKVDYQEKLVVFETTLTAFKTNILKLNGAKINTTPTIDASIEMMGKNVGIFLLQQQNFAEIVDQAKVMVNGLVAHFTNNYLQLKDNELLKYKTILLKLKDLTGLDHETCNNIDLALNQADETIGLAKTHWDQVSLLQIRSIVENISVDYNGSRKITNTSKNIFTNLRMAFLNANRSLLEIYVQTLKENFFVPPKVSFEKLANDVTNFLAEDNIAFKDVAMPRESVFSAVKFMTTNLNKALIELQTKKNEIVLEKNPFSTIGKLSQMDLSDCKNELTNIQSRLTGFINNYKNLIATLYNFLPIIAQGIYDAKGLELQQYKDALGVLEKALTFAENNYNSAIDSLMIVNTLLQQKPRAVLTNVTNGMQPGEAPAVMDDVALQQPKLANGMQPDVAPIIGANDENHRPVVQMS